jgi:hypothetical protein
MGEFYGIFLGITTKCSSVNHRKITLEYEKWCIQHKLMIRDAYELQSINRLPILVCLFILLRMKMFRQHIILLNY